MKLRLMLLIGTVLLGSAMAGAAVADSSYVARPQGWFVLVPPLTKPDPVTGSQTVDEAAPEKRWSAMVIHGRDGNNYDFADEHLCETWLNLVGMKLYEMPNATFSLHWLSKSRCVKDDKRRSVMTNERWSRTMEKYIHE